MTRQMKVLKTTAYHEAGHAAAAFRLRRRVRHVTIVPEDDSLGHMLSGKLPETFQPDIDSDRRTDRWLERLTLIVLAGPIAEAQFTGRYNHIGASSDYHRAVTWASYAEGSTKLVKAYLHYMQARAEAMTTQQSQWVAIEALAEALLEHQHLSGRKARLIWLNAPMERMARVEELSQIQWEESEKERIRGVEAYERAQNRKRR